jgi:hypothetical protein
MPSSAPRQAVVIIHGIGEQHPMDTLRNFVKAITRAAGLTEEDVTRRALSKPDYISPALELRRMAVPGDTVEWKPGRWVSTDFYELYWAHLMTGTSWHHVTAWAGTLLLQWPWKVPSRLAVPWTISWVVVLIGTYMLTGPQGPKSASEWSLVGALITLALVLFKSKGIYFGLQYAGDAARYLSPTPPNVGVRQAIRSAAVDLLEGLHDDPTWRRYHRIILVGHSLGSVIGYDALTHFWQRRHHPPDKYLRCVEQPYLEQYQKTGNGEQQLEIEPRPLQSALWREQREIGVQWKITDFVTLGSPLAHARFLMAADRDELEERVTQREYPSCPPQPNDDRDQQYGTSLLTTTAGCRLLHHAALFACTRWTNLYFDKDFIGGPIDDLGEWIVNKQVPPQGPFPHARYWRDASHLGHLLAALDLDGWWTDERNTSIALAAQDRDSELLNPSEVGVPPGSGAGPLRISR